jgi:hypothetical protein
MVSRKKSAGIVSRRNKTAGLTKGESTMRSISLTAVALLVLTAIASAKEPPNAPSAVASGEAFIEESPISKPALAPRLAEVKNVDAKFISLSLISSGSAFADSYTTLFARENWLAGKKNVCNVEVESAYLYGTHPTVGRAYAVASVKSAGSVLAAYYLRKHHSRLWILPLLANSATSLQGVAQNMATCN